MKNHGKGPMDGIGGTVKNVIFRKVKSGHCQVRTPIKFCEQSNKYTNIKSLYVLQSEVPEEPEEIKAAPGIENTLKVHKVVWKFNAQGVMYTEFFYLSEDPEPFHTQFYWKPEHPPVRQHQIFPKDDFKCAGCNKRYGNNEGDAL